MRNPMKNKKTSPNIPAKEGSTKESQQSLRTDNRNRDRDRGNGWIWTRIVKNIKTLHEVMLLYWFTKKKVQSSEDEQNNPTLTKNQKTTSEWGWRER